MELPHDPHADGPAHDRHASPATYAAGVSLPRSAALAAWLAAVLADRAAVGDAVSAVVRDEAHEVTWAPTGPRALAMEAAAGHPVPDPAYLSDLVVLVSAAAETARPAVRVALPAPGDAAGLPAVPELVGHACDAGECVVVEGLGGPTGTYHLATVPDVTTFGSEAEPGYRVTWTVWASRTPPQSGAVGAAVSVAEAHLELRLALREVATELERLDVAAWSPRRRAVSRRPRPTDLPPLPDTFGPRARSLLASAADILTIVEAAVAEPGGTVSGHEVDARAAALTRVHRAARRAVEAAVNLPG
jgi:hypothetical protein